MILAERGSLIPHLIDLPLVIINTMATFSFGVDEQDVFDMPVAYEDEDDFDDDDFDFDDDDFDDFDDDFDDEDLDDDDFEDLDDEDFDDEDFDEEDY